MILKICKPFTAIALRHNGKGVNYKYPILCNKMSATSKFPMLLPLLTGGMRQGGEERLEATSKPLHALMKVGQGF